MAVEHHEESHGLTPRQYIMIFVALAAVTAVELALSYSDLGRGPLIGLLFFLSAVKFAVVVAFFMHLRFDFSIFKWLFVGSFALGTLVLLALIGLFWNDVTHVG